MKPAHTIPREMVGLSMERPFRFCTMHYGSPGFRWIRPGDDLNPPSEMIEGHRAIELFTPELEAARQIAPHDHEFYEIVVIRQGTGIHMTAEGEIPMKRGDVFIMTPRGTHGFRDISGLVKTNIYLQPEWLQEDLKPLFREDGLSRFLLSDALLARSPHEGFLHLRATEDELVTCENEVADMTREALEPRPSLILLNACFLKVLWILNKACKRSNRYNDLPLRPEVWMALELIEKVIQDGRPFSVGELADRLGLSKSSLFRLFKEAAGKSPMDYYQDRRIRTAEDLLWRTNDHVTDIAHRLGFADSGHFSRTFKAIVGQSPSTYRLKRLRRMAAALPR